jgi:flagellar motor switch protein FliN/FliY
MYNFTELEEKLLKLDKSGQHLTPADKDVLGEVGNICMGASATTMYSLLGRRVTITTPQVHVYSSQEVLSVYESPFVLVTVEYTKGIHGKNLLILREYDSLLIPIS